MGLLPANLFSGGGEKGQAMYALTQSGKIALDNGDGNGPELQILMAVDNMTQATASKIAKESGVEKQKTVALLGSLKNRKLVTKVN
jgi:DNA-binding MarR family transcriptional regulator